MNRCAEEIFSHKCTKVEISKIDVFHSDDYCYGIHVEYRSTFSNGCTELTAPPQHIYNSGYYAHGRGFKISRITLREGEYLAEIRTRQGEILPIKLHSLQINEEFLLEVMVVVVKICLFHQI